MKHSQLTSKFVNEIALPGYYLDGVGLYLQVREQPDSGKITKSWVFRYTINARVRDMGLGGFPMVPLASARKLALEAREHLLRGLDPLDLRQAQRDKVRTDKLENILFRDATAKFLKLREDLWRNAKHKQQWKNTLDTYAMKSLGSRRAVDIGEADISDALHSIWTTKQETAWRVKKRIQRICSWVKEGMPLPQQATSKRVKHHAAMQRHELPAFMAELRAIEGTTARALEFLILTAARTGEVIGATWGEIDLKAKTWTIPAERMKAHREHVVPLSDRAVEILKGLPRIADHIFPGAKAGQGISNMTMAKLLRKITGNGDTVHGFRSTFRDWAGDSTSFPREVIEHALAHQLKDKTEKAYRRGNALEKRRALMQQWARFCEAPLIEGSNVVQLAG